MRKLATFWIVFVFLLSLPGYAAEISEIPDPTHTDIRVRENPKTGRPYVSIVRKDAPEGRMIYQGKMKKYPRPDYAMLDSKTKSGQIHYEGPSSSRKKVYALAAALATSGVLAGTLTPVAAATGAGAAGSGAGYALAGAGVAAGTVSAAWLKSRPDPTKDSFVHESKATLTSKENQKGGNSKS